MHAFKCLVRKKKRTLRENREKRRLDSIGRTRSLVEDEEHQLTLEYEVPSQLSRPQGGFKSTVYNLGGKRERERERERERDDGGGKKI